MTPRTFLISGLLAGLLGGLLAFGVALAVGEPAIDAAIAVEEAGAATEHDHDHDEEAGGHSHADEAGAGITRGKQAGPGLLTATMLFGVVLGGVTALGAAFSTGRLGSLGVVGGSVLVTGLGFLSFTLLPWLAYPPNPPAVGSGDTIDERTATYFGFVALSLLAVVAAVLLARRLLAVTSPWTAVVAGGAAYLLVVGVAALLLPGIEEAPDSFPATTLFEFRIGSLLTQAALWLGIGVGLSGLLHRARRAELADRARRDLAASL